MGIDRPAFTRTRTDEERADDDSKVIPVRLSKVELEWLEADARFLRQEKMSTIIKQLMKIGHICINEPATRTILEVGFENDRKNERLGIGEVKPDFTQM